MPSDRPPMICGGIYEYIDYRKVKVEATLVSKETLAQAPNYQLLGEQPVVEGSAKPEDTTKTY